MKTFQIIDDISGFFAAKSNGEPYQFSDEIDAKAFARELNVRHPDRQFAAIQTGGNGTMSRQRLINTLLENTNDSGYGRMRR